jgi:hypothetical protein
MVETYDQEKKFYPKTLKNIMISICYNKKQNFSGHQNHPALLKILIIFLKSPSVSG